MVAESSSEGGSGTKEPSERRQLLHFMVRETQCCLRLEDVERVLPLMALEKLPAGQEDLVGLLNWHGRTVPVADLGILLGLAGARPYDLGTPVLLCGDDDQTVGFVVADVIGVEPIEEKELQLGPALAVSSLPLVAVVQTSRGVSALLDLRGLLIGCLPADDPPAQLARAERGTA